jgi:hypothetical protein
LTSSRLLRVVLLVFFSILNEAPTTVSGEAHG